MLGSLDGESGITFKRLRAIVKRFFASAADTLGDANPALAEKLRRATPHWMRHTRATHALQRGAELTTVRDKLRQASLSTTSMYLLSDDLRRAKQIGGVPFDAAAASVVAYLLTAARLASSIFAIALRCTSSGPSTMRTVR